MLYRQLHFLQIGQMQQIVVPDIHLLELIYRLLLCRIVENFGLVAFPLVLQIL